MGRQRLLLLLKPTWVFIEEEEEGEEEGGENWAVMENLHEGTRGRVEIKNGFVSGEERERLQKAKIRETGIPVLLTKAIIGSGLSSVPEGN